MKGGVFAVDSTHVNAYNQRAPDNRTRRSNSEARVGRNKRDFILGYWVHAACYAGSELLLAFRVALCNMNEKTYFKPLLDKMHSRVVRFKIVVTDAQYSSAKVRAVAEAYGAEPVRAWTLQK